MRRLPRPARAGLALLGLALGAVALLAALDAAFPFPLERLTPPPATRVLARDGTELRRFLAADGMWRFPVRLDEVAPELVTALVESEDRWFRVHPGVNPLAVLRAAWTNALAGRVVSGASTIPMQVARLAEPRPRTLTAKLIEALRAMQLGLRHSRTEILELYLNAAPFGGNIVGVGAAARLYFDKPADQLSLGECALLAVLPRAPGRYDPARHPEAALAVRDRVLAQLARRGAVSPEAAHRAMRQPMVAQRSASAMRAPHFTQLVRARLGARPLVATTLDPEKQAVAERLVARHVALVRPLGLTNAAAVVVDRRTRDVLALVGSADFFDDAFQGQVNNALAPRSPGSALKPFLYALAFDKGLAIPESRLLDVPTDFAGYAPENYSGTFSGQVTVTEALARSLNLPAVRLLARVGVADFHALLRRGGLESIDRPAGHYGLALALGACEVRLADLTNLYATLAQGGVHRPWRVVAETPGAAPEPVPAFAPGLTPGPAPGPAPAFAPGFTPGFALFSPEAARAVGEILTRLTRPDMPDAWRLTRDRPPAAWKTGTSFGHKDAWAVGFGATLAVGVWVGNPDGAPVNGISGTMHAGPLFFDLLRALEPPARDVALPAAPNMREVRLCAASRLPAGPDCPETLPAQAGPRLALPRCTDHRRIMVDAETGLRLEGDCLLIRPARARTVRTVPPELAAWMAAQGRPVPALAALHPDCRDVPPGAGPVILSPCAATQYVLRDDLPAEYQQIALRATPADPGQRMWWYVDGRLVGMADARTPLFLPMTPGRHVVSVTDELGRTSTEGFVVR